MGKFRYVTFTKCYVTAKSFFDVPNSFWCKNFLKGKERKQNIRIAANFTEP